MAQSQVYLLDLVSKQAKWLSQRQTIIAGNISNSDTPGFKAQDIAPFQQIMNQTGIELTTTNPAHMTIGGSDAGDNLSAPTEDAETWDTKVSGNSVSVEQELIKEGDINRSYGLNTGISRIFHQMILSALK